MKQPFRVAIVVTALVGILMSCLGHAEDGTRLKRQPDEFAIIFLMGYGGDSFPRDPARFEKLIVAAKEAHYNVVLCKYEDWRAEICKRHGMKIIVDLLTPAHHVYKSIEGAEQLCRSLRDSDDVYAYHLWSDRIGGTIAGRSRDVANVHRWDPGHPTYVGSYNGRSVGDLDDADIIGYYDFHWKRGGLWRHLHRMTEAARKNDASFLKYADGAPGRVGAGNYNRVLYTISMSLAFGMKGYMYHHTGGEIDQATWKWTVHGDDLARVNAEIAPLGPLLMTLRNPAAVYSTPMTRTAKDRETGEDSPSIPAGLAGIPADSWFQVKTGEAVVGVFQDDQKRDALLFANHNAYQAQEMQVEFGAGVKAASRFDRREGKWKPLQLNSRSVKFVIPPAAPELVLVAR